MKQWEVSANDESTKQALKHLDEVPVEMKQWEVPVYALLEQNIRRVKKIDEVLMRERSDQNISQLFWNSHRRPVRVFWITRKFYRVASAEAISIKITSVENKLTDIRKQSFFIFIFKQNFQKWQVYFTSFFRRCHLQREIRFLKFYIVFITWFSGEKKTYLCYW